jgi:thiol-disulfide isomerase/thioredoxin
MGEIHHVMNLNKKDKKRSGIKRSLLEWGGIAAVVAIFYLTGLHTEVLGAMQRVLLWSGLHNAKPHKVAAADGPMLSQNAYNMQLATPNGKLVKLEKYKGKVLFVNIWASWCPPCVAEMPTIKTLYDKVSDNDNIKFLLISMDEEKKNADSFMKRKKFPMPYYFPASGMPSVFQSSYIPSTYVVSKEGKIIYQHGGIANYGTKKFRKWLVKQAE